LLRSPLFTERETVITSEVDLIYLPTLTLHRLTHDAPEGFVLGLGC
jgi:hypothetical protein